MVRFSGGRGADRIAVRSTIVDEVKQARKRATLILARLTTASEYYYDHSEPAADLVRAPAAGFTALRTAWEASAHSPPAGPRATSAS